MLRNPILIDVPDRLDTQRLCMRSLKAGDGPALFEVVRESILALRQYPAFMAWAIPDPSLDSTETFCRTQQAAFIARRDFSYLVMDRDESIIGCAGIHRIDWTTPKAEIGFWRRPSAQGQGLIAEATVALRTMAIERLHFQRLEIVTDARNVAARKTAQRAGFYLEAVRRNERRESAKVWCDAAVYVRVPDA